MSGRGKGSCGLGAHSKRPIHPTEWAEYSDEKRTEILSQCFDEGELKSLAEIDEENRSVVPKLLAMISALTETSKEAILKIGTKTGKYDRDGEPKYHGEHLLEWTEEKNEKDMGDYFDLDERTYIEVSDLPFLIVKIGVISVALKKLHRGNEELIKSIFNIRVA